MSASVQTGSKSGRFKTIVLIIGVIVAVMIGLSVSASPIESLEISSHGKGYSAFSWMLADFQSGLTLIVKALLSI